MKIQSLFLATVAAVLVLGAGCKSLLGTNAAPQSVPVTFGSATTNDANLVAWLEFAKDVNVNANPTPTAAPINTALTALIALASVAVGAYAHAKGVGSASSQTVSSAPPASAPPKV